MEGMRRIAIVVFGLLAAGSAAAAIAAPPAFRATLTVSTTRPAVEAKMTYVVRVTNAGGKPLAARLTIRIVDPFGGSHPVEFDDSTRLVRDIRFVGRFSDAVEWPQSAVGFPLKFQAVVKVGTSTRVLSRTITVR